MEQNTLADTRRNEICICVRDRERQKKNHGEVSQINKRIRRKVRPESGIQVCTSRSFRYRIVSRQRKFRSCLVAHPSVLSFLNIYRPRVATRNCVNFSNKPDDCVNHPGNELPRRFVATLIRSSLKILLKVYPTCLRLISETLVD